jgi:hypothetical protein
MVWPSHKARINSSVHATKLLGPDGGFSGLRTETFSILLSDDR